MAIRTFLPKCWLHFNAWTYSINTCGVWSDIALFSLQSSWVKCLCIHSNWAGDVCVCVVSMIHLFIYHIYTFAYDTELPSASRIGSWLWFFFLSNTHICTHWHYWNISPSRVCVCPLRQMWSMEMVQHFSCKCAATMARQFPEWILYSMSASIQRQFIFANWYLFSRVCELL